MVVGMVGGEWGTDGDGIRISVVSTHYKQQ